MKFILENWFKLIMVFAIFVFGGIATFFAYLEYQPSIQKNKAEKIKLEKSLVEKERQRSCESVYYSELRGINPPSGYEYNLYQEKCILRYKKSVTKSTAECQREFDHLSRERIYGEEFDISRYSLAVNNCSSDEETRTFDI